MQYVVRTFRSAVPVRPDQPPLKLRRSAEASAKAEGLHYAPLKSHVERVNRAIEPRENRLPMALRVQLDAIGIEANLFG